jgi:hypothetical protein
MNIFKKAGFIVIVVALTGLTAFALPTNGDFSISDPTNPNFGWTIDPEGSVTVFEGRAIFSENSSYPSGTLSQEFTIPALAVGLSFDFQYLLSGGINETDYFTASLLNPITMESLTEKSTFFYWDSDGLVLRDPTEVTILYPGEPNTMMINLTIPSSIWDSNALLAFAFFADEEAPFTSINLDNVSVSIPAPAAVVLGIIGTGVVGLWRRFGRGV